jgi:geranylgeranyl reductase family protein
MYDVVVAGAGPGGSATSYYLAQHGLRVLLLDKADFPRDKTCGDGLTPRALSVLDDMGVLDRLAQTGCRISGLEIYAPNGQSIAAPVPASAGRPPFMLVVPRFILDNTLREHAIAHGVHFEGRTHVTAIEPSGTGVTVRAERNGAALSFSGRVAVVATGANVRLPLSMGLLREVPPTMAAARAYYDDLTGLNDHVQLRFDGVLLPGYAWIFPTSAHSANVGAGFFGKGKQRQHMLASPQDAFTAFIHGSHAKDSLARARRTSPIKSYPLRVDFTSAPTFGQRTLLVGEAAGLVNPLSGEGVDYALESGKVAAEHLVAMFNSDDFNPEQFEAYDRALRDRFQSLFLLCNRVCELFLNRPVLNVLVSLAAHRADLKVLLIRIVLGDQTVPRHISAVKVLKVLLTGAARPAFGMTSKQ